MNIEFRKSFERDLLNIDDTALLQKIQAAIVTIEIAVSPHEIPSLKKMKGKGNYYRIRIGDYRMGLMLEKDTFVIVRVLPRKEIYRYFP